MGRHKINLLGLLLALAAAQLAASKVNRLDQAREALNSGDTKAAFKNYGKISKDDPQWEDRVEDAIRFQLLKGNPQEAWRITQLAERTQTKVDDINYYGSLAAIQGQACPLNRVVEDESWRLLLLAHAYRFPTRFRSPGYNGAPYSVSETGKLQNHVVANDIHYLTDIPTAKLLKKMGCRFLHKRMEDLKVAKSYEYKSLLQWYQTYYLTTPEDKRLPGSDTVLERILILASDQKDEKTRADLVTRYKNLSDDQWVKIGEPLRRFLWQELTDAKVIPPPPLEVKDPLANRIRKIILATDSAHAYEWLGAVKFEDWDENTRFAIYDHLLNLKTEDEEQAYRPFLLVKKAAILHHRGQVQDALNIIRQLLVLGESSNNADVENVASDIATAILSEFRYDSAVVGALQSSVPVMLWGQVLRNMIIEHALSGNLTGFDKLVDLGLSNKKHGGAATGLSKDDIHILRSMASRNARAFGKSIQEMARRPRLMNQQLRLFTEIGAKSMALSTKEFAAVDPYFLQIATLLQDLIDRGKQVQTLDELAHLFDPKARSERARGSNTVAKGTFRAGVVDLKEGRTVSNPFEWSKPETPPPADLLVIPASVTERGWVIR